MLERCKKGDKIVPGIYVPNVWTPYYGVRIWARYNSATLRKLNVAYNKMFRKLLNIPRFKTG